MQKRCLAHTLRLHVWRKTLITKDKKEDWLCFWCTQSRAID